MTMSRMFKCSVWFALFLAVCVSVTLAQCPTPGATTLSSPSGDTPSRRPNFYWHSVADAAWYYIWIEKDGVVYHREWLFGNTSWVPDETMPEGNYRWWVRTWNPCGDGAWSSPMTFTRICTAIDNPWLGSPNNVVLPDRGYPPQIQWYGSPYATWAGIYIERNSSVFYDQWTQAFGYGYGWTPDFDFPCGTYRWKVREWEACGGATAWSSTGFFEIVCCTGAPAAVLNLAADFYPPYGYGIDVYNPRPSLEWTAVEHATWYYLYVKRNGSQYKTEWQTANNWRPTEDLPAGDYEMWVKTWNPCGEGQFSDRLDFSIMCTNPPAPTGLSFWYGYAYGYGYGGSGGGAPAWDALPGTYWYQLYILKGTQIVYNRWLDLQGDWGDIYAKPGKIFASPELDMDPPFAGTYNWWVRGWNRCGLGEWSSMGTATMTCQAVAPTISGPSGTITTVRPFFEWSPLQQVDEFELYITRDGTKYYQITREAQNPTIAPPKGGVSPAVERWIPHWDLPEGGYQWWVRAISECSGTSDWSTPGSFTIDVP